MPTMPTAPAAVDPNPAATAARLRLAVTRLHRVLRQQSADGPTLTQLSALATVGRFGPITLGDLARVQQLSPPRATSITNSGRASSFSISASFATAAAKVFVSAPSISRIQSSWRNPAIATGLRGLA